ncbi:hypothetical protein HHK36_004473 [Tetracentron sinense]|uniref:Uncharacterized protein n=1 Tax=Tetracentron sinense TaxID=13715 RepID=A0A834ZUI1_TETSI|nr:hypothetical protein HHK36_004473 [Tetracentron sinense]
MGVGNPSPWDTRTAVVGLIRQPRGCCSSLCMISPSLFCLHGPSLADHRLNCPMCLPVSLKTGMSPRSIQKAASDAAMTIDTELAPKFLEKKVIESGMIQGLDSQIWEDEYYNSGVCLGSDLIEAEALNFSSIDDLEIYLWQF